MAFSASQDVAREDNNTLLYVGGGETQQGKEVVKDSAVRSTSRRTREYYLCIYFEMEITRQFLTVGGAYRIAFQQEMLLNANNFILNIIKILLS